MVTQSEFDRASLDANEFQERVPKAISARYDPQAHRVLVELSSRIGIFFSPDDAEGLERATPDDLALVEITPSGYGLHFPKLDADLYLPTLLKGTFGSERWTANRKKQHEHKTTEAAADGENRTQASTPGKRTVAAAR